MICFTDCSLLCDADSIGSANLSKDLVKDIPVVLLNRHLIGTSPDKGLDASLVFLNEWILQIGGDADCNLSYRRLQFIFFVITGRLPRVGID
jgi:hypothetical protein